MPPHDLCSDDADAELVCVRERERGREGERERGREGERERGREGGEREREGERERGTVLVAERVL